MFESASNRSKVPMNILVFLALLFAGLQVRLESADLRPASTLQCRGKAAALEPGRCAVDVLVRKGVKAVPFPLLCWETPGLVLALEFHGFCAWAAESSGHGAGERGGCKERAPPAVA